MAALATSFQAEILQIWLTAATKQEHKVSKLGGTCSPGLIGALSDFGDATLQ